MSIAITEAITTIAEAEQRFNLSRTEDERFFPEWQMDLLNLLTAEQTALEELRRRYLYQLVGWALLTITFRILPTITL